MAGLSANGSLIYTGDGASPEVFTAIANMGDIAGPKKSASVVDTSTHNNTDGYSEFITTLKTGGEVSFPVNWDPANATHVNLDALLEAGALTNMQLREARISPVKKWSFVGVVTGIDFSYPVAGKISANVTIKVSGKPTHS